MLRLACINARERDAFIGVVVTLYPDRYIAELKRVAPELGGAWSEENGRAEWQNGSSVAVHEVIPRENTPTIEVDTWVETAYMEEKDYGKLVPRERRARRRRRPNACA